MRSIRISAVSLASVLAGACGGGSTTSPTTTPVSSPAPATTARYQVTFETAWSRESHPTDFPANPHFSPLIGVTHSPRAQFWRTGATASNGIEAMAEMGRVSPLDTEFGAAVALGSAHRVLRGASIPSLPGSAGIDFEIDRDQPLVTLVSMIAPSPDWFVGVHDLELIEGSRWVDEKVVVLFPYDAGTDDGASYESPDRDTEPKGPIGRLDDRPVAIGGVVAPFGTFTFRRLP